MNWGALLEELRMDLDDTSDNPKYSDQQLYVYTREAFADYSQYFPLNKNDVTLAVDPSNAKKFVLPADFLHETSVACPATHFLEPRRGRLGARTITGNRPLFYTRDSADLYLDVAPGTNPVVINYDAKHPMPADAADATFEITISEVNIELIKLYVEARVNVKIRNAQSRLDRFKIGAGSRSDNPMVTEVEDMFKTYKEKLAERLPPNTLTLYRPRKYK